MLVEHANGSRPFVASAEVLELKALPAVLEALQDAALDRGYALDRIDAVASPDGVVLTIAASKAER